MHKKIIYACSYVPYQQLSQYGYEMINLFELTDCLGMNHGIQGNLCSFIKKICKYDFSQYDGIILTNCCNSVQRLYDYLKYNAPNLFVYLMELPRTGQSTEHITKLINTMNQHFGIQDYSTRMKLKNPDFENDNYDILVLTTSIHRDYIQELNRIFEGYHIRCESCYGVPRGDQQLTGIKVSCPRRLDYIDYIKPLIKKSKAVVYVVTEKCDPSIFTYPLIKEICTKEEKKCLMIEEEFKNTISERSRIRYEAFIESLLLRNVRSNE